MHAIRLTLVHLVTAHELQHRRIAQILMVVATQQVIQNAEPERALRKTHPVEIEGVEYGRHDGKTTGEYRQAFSAETRYAQTIHITAAQQHRAQLLHAVAGERTVAPAVELHDVEQGSSGTARTHSFIPSQIAEAVFDRFKLSPGGQLGLAEGSLVYPAVREVLQAEGDTAHIKRLERQRFEASTDNEFG